MFPFHEDEGEIFMKRSLLRCIVEWMTGQEPKLYLLKKFPSIWAKKVLDGYLHENRLKKSHFLTDILQEFLLLGELSIPSYTYTCFLGIGSL